MEALSVGSPLATRWLCDVWSPVKAGNGSGAQAERSPARVCSDDVSSHRGLFFNTTYRCHTSQHHSPAVLQNPALSAAGTAGGREVQGLLWDLSQALPAIGGIAVDMWECCTVWTCNLKSCKTELLLRCETAEQNKLTSSAATAWHLDTDIAL